MQFYAPVIVDATLTGRTPCYIRGLNAVKIMSHLRTGDKKEVDKGPYSYPILSSIPPEYEPFTSVDLNGHYVRGQNLSSSGKTMRAASES